MNKPTQLVILYCLFLAVSVPVRLVAQYIGLLSPTTHWLEYFIVAFICLLLWPLWAKLARRSLWLDSEEPK